MQDMQNKLRKKFIFISMSSVFVVIFLIAVIINVTVYVQLNAKSDEIINILSDNNGRFPRGTSSSDDYILPSKMSKEIPFSTRFFSLRVDGDLKTNNIDINNIIIVNRENAIDFAFKIIELDDMSGYFNNFKFLVTEHSYGKLIVFVDCTEDLELLKLVFMASVSICFMAFISIFILIFVFSERAISPIVLSYDKQKRFITDVSHELKTPLTIIKTNNEVIEIVNGETEWSQNINFQVDKLSNLISNLISLTKVDEQEHVLDKVEFSLSDAVFDCGGQFDLVASNENKDLLLDIQESINYNGDEGALRQVICILLDNSIKYANTNSTISVTLKKQGEKIRFKITNYTDGIKKGKHNVLFERFYRSDESRHTTGYGIGLSIAKSIIEKHKGRIKAESSSEGEISFTIDL
ncbi:MAG: HAMP domain-containing sensor histidine kinase [bacterium]